MIKNLTNLFSNLFFKKENKKMKLGIAYNIFNGEELLEDSLKRLRKHADYIILTYQTISNVGIKEDTNLFETLNKIDKSLFEDIVLFEPDFDITPKLNQTNKRQLGLEMARKNECTHFMTTDCDEFYIDEQFEYAKKVIQKYDYKSTACELINYFHTSSFQMCERKQYVPFIFKINAHTKFKFQMKMKVPVEPARVCSNRKFYLFDKNELLMHHMSYVRKNTNSLKSKLINSPNLHMFKDIVEDYLMYYERWTPKQPAVNPHVFKSGKMPTENINIIKNPIKLTVKFDKSKDTE